MPQDTATAFVTAAQAKTRPQRPHVAVIVPVHNEEESIGPFLKAVRPVLDGLEADWSVLFINDGSRDRTLDVLIGAMRDEARISIINFARNFGKEAAMTAGLDAVDADAVIVMDVDLQDPPELIAEFVRHWRAGYDVVYGARSQRRSDSFLKRFTAARFYSMFNKVSNVPIPSNVGDFRLIDRRVVRSLGELRERNRFMKGLFAWVGYPSMAVPYERPVRPHGETKFGFRRLWNFALDGIFGFSTLPLKAWTYLGLLLAVFAVLYAVYLTVRTLLFGIDVPGYASLMVAILMVGAFQLTSLGIIGEYIARLTLESKSRPIYIVENHYKAGDL
ncbi:MAG: glycosyltransferase family 2 protein [Hyphomonas sp.]|uniref:glycosyltransferase family 2 protein n=1 Tax=Hyphomonas sp. TaxID=87 RepID=UPI003527802A